MAIRVPELQESVGLSNPGAPGAPGLTPPPESAFGGDIAAQTGDTGRILEQAGEQLGEHMRQRQEMAQRAQVLAKNTQFYEKLQDVMTSTEPMEQIDPQTGERSTIPRGVFAQHGLAAQGATQRFDVAYKALRADALSDPTNSLFQKTLLDDKISTDYPRYRELVAKHEAEQVRMGTTAITDAAVNQEIQNSPLYASDPNMLAFHMNWAAAQKHANLVGNGAEQDEIGKKVYDIRDAMVSNAVKAKIDADPKPAMDLIDGLKSLGEISPTDYDKQKQIILNGARQVAERNKFFLEQGQEQNAGKLLDEVTGPIKDRPPLSELKRQLQENPLLLKDADKKHFTNIMSSDKYLSGSFWENGASDDPATYNDIRANQISRQYTPEQIRRQITEAVADNKLTDNSSTYLKSKTNEMKPDPRDNDISSQAQAVRDFGNRFIHPNPVSVVDTYFQGGKKSQSQRDKDVEDMVRNFTDQVDKENASGDRLKEIAQQTIDTAQIKRYPELANIPRDQWPDAVRNVNGMVDRLFNPKPSKAKGQKVTIPPEDYQ